MRVLDSEIAQNWEFPLPCRHCRTPVAESAAICPHCQGATRLWSTTSLLNAIACIQRGLRRLLHILAVLVLGGVALALAYLLSPLLLLFPLLMVVSPPSAGRGGKTVVRGRPR